MSVSDAVRQGFAWRGLTMVSQIQEARTMVAHNAVYGENNEYLLIQALQDFLPTGWTVGSGQIIDCDGKPSPQCDVIIYHDKEIPVAHRTKAGKVVVFADSVGAVIEVKSCLYSGKNRKSESTSSQALGLQMAKLDTFLRKALDKTRLIRESEIKKREGEGHVGALVTSRAEACKCDAGSSWHIHVFGFAFESCIGAQTLKEGLKCGYTGSSSPHDVFVMDLPADLAQMQAAITKVAKDPKRLNIEAYRNQIRWPNGYRISREGADKAFAMNHHQTGSDTLRLLVRELSKRIRDNSPMKILHTPGSGGWIYSQYNPEG